MHVELCSYLTNLAAFLFSDKSETLNSKFHLNIILYIFYKKKKHAVKITLVFMCTMVDKHFAFAWKHFSICQKTTIQNLKAVLLGA